MERWIGIDAGADPNGYPKTKYRHESCGAVVDGCSPYCPNCGKRVNCVKVFRDGFEDVIAKLLKERGYIVE